MPQPAKKKYKLYLASGITLWKEYFSKEYSRFFNKKIELFEPATLDSPDDHRKIPIGIACFDLDKINHADALLVYMKNYKTLDGSPTGTDSTWECGYAIGHGKPVIMLIENPEHMDYYSTQWMVTFSINAIITTNKAVAELAKNHPKFVHVSILYAQGYQEFESKIIEYLDNYYRSIYSRSGIINYYVDEQARQIFSRAELEKRVFTNQLADKKVFNLLGKLDRLEFKSDKDALKVCEVERNITAYIKKNLSFKEIDSAIAAVIEYWDKPSNHILNCLEHSIAAPFAKVKDHKQGIKKTRPELFYELYDLVVHHLIREQRFIKTNAFPYEVGAVVELYNWMNTYSLDDVFDNSEYRQKTETVWKKFSRRDAILTGILGHFLALKYMIAIADDNLLVGILLAEILNAYNGMMYDGQIVDLMLTLDSTKKKSILKKKFNVLADLYVEKIYKICGGFYEAIGLMAAKAGNKEEQVINAKQIDIVSPLVGLYYGLIQMIRNDLGDYLSVEDLSKMSKGMKGLSHSDITEGKIDLCYILTFHSPNVTSAEKKFLLNVLHTKLDEKKKLEINRILWKSGSINLVVALIQNIIEYVKKELLSCYHETPTRMKWMFNLVNITSEILIPFKRMAEKNKWTRYEYDQEILEKLTQKILAVPQKYK